MKKSIFVALVLVSLCLISQGATPDQAAAAGAAKPAPKINDLFGDTVVAKGKGVEVKRDQLDEEVSRLKSQAALHGQSIPPEHLNLFERQILDQMIQIQLLAAK